MRASREKWHNMRMRLGFVAVVAVSALLASGCSWLQKRLFPDHVQPLSSSGRISVTPDNGVWDEEYGRTDEARGCSFDFEVMRCAKGVRVLATVRDDCLVTDNCAAGSVSCPSWDDDNLEVFFDGDNDRSRDSREGDGLKYGGEFTLVANGAANSDFSGQPKSFGKTWTGTVGAQRQADGTWLIEYELFFDWSCLGYRRPPRADQDVTFGFNICVHDDDDGGRNDRALYWKGNPARPYRDESQFGVITLKGVKQ